MTNISLIHKEIIKLIKQSKSPVFSVFDFDNTCIVNDITEATLAYMARNNLFRDKNLLEVKFENSGNEIYSKTVFNNYYSLLDKGRVKEAYEFISKILSGFYVNEIKMLSNEVINFEGKNIMADKLFGRKINKGIKPREEIIELINFIKDNGVEVWIVSASLEVLVRETMKHFNIKAEVIGVRNVVVDNKFTAKVKKPMPMFEGKVECIKKFIDFGKNPLIGAGDSVNDLPMLEYCKTKMVVGRDNVLVDKARENNWFLIS